MPSLNKYIQQSLEVHEPQCSGFHPFVIILIPLFRHFMAGSNKSGWDHTARGLAFPTFVLLHRSP